MTMSADAIARRESSRGNGTTGGEFGYQPHSLPGELDVPDTGRAEIEALLEPSRGRDDFEDRVAALTELRDILGDQFGSHAIDRMNDGGWRPDLAYVDYDDKLRPAQMDEYLADSDELMNSDEDREWLDNNTYDRAEEVAMSVLGDEEGEDGDFVDNEELWNELGTSEQDSLRQWAHDWDESAPVDVLIRHTPSQLVQLPVAGAEAALNDSPDLNHSNPDVAFKARERMLQKLFTASGIGMTEKNRESIRELITEGMGGTYEPFSNYRIKVLAYTELEQVTLSGIRTDRPNNVDVDVDRRVTSTNPHVLVIQRSSGYGHDVQLEGRLTSHVTPDSPAVVDDNQGYGSWNEVAGVDKPGYAPVAPPESEWIARD